MIVLVCGGRDYSNGDYLFEKLDEVYAEFGTACIVHGDAKGADSLADMWANKRGVDVIRCPADWSAHGRAAGPTRNASMLKDYDPNVVVAFPGGKGTDHMVEISKKHGCIIVDLR